MTRSRGPLYPPPPLRPLTNCPNNFLSIARPHGLPCFPAFPTASLTLLRLADGELFLQPVPGSPAQRTAIFYSHGGALFPFQLRPPGRRHRVTNLAPKASDLNAHELPLSLPAHRFGLSPSKKSLQLLNLLTLGLWSKVGRLTHYAFDAVLSTSPQCQQTR